MANTTGSIGETGDLYGLPSYVHLVEHSGIMMAHVIFMAIAWIFALPVGIVFSIAGHRYALTMRSIFLAVSGFGLVFGIVVNHKAEDLYEGNAHRTIGWVAMGMAAVHVLTDVLLHLTNRSRTNHTEAVGTIFHASTKTGPDSSHEVLHIGHDRSGVEYEGSEADDDEADEDEHKGLVHSHQDFPRKYLIYRYFSLRTSGLTLSGLSKMSKFLCKLIDWTILLVGYVALVTGGVIYTGIFRGRHIFNGLAHFIKGGIFFWYGLLTLGRWLGCFSNLGWAWNVEPPSTRTVMTASIPSAEFAESFVIFLYGSTNMFLEHLAGWGKAWSASDLEHVSISILFFGGGLCGMLVESKIIRLLLNTKIERMAARIGDSPAQASHLRKLPKTYDSSPNTIPALIVLLLGIMMSSHHQSSTISTAIHKQWGMLLSGFAVMRILTYIMLYISPATSIFPSRPPTELVASFCLISGGIVLMASTTDIVQWIETSGLMAMFVFMIAMALTALIMAWEIAVLSIKGWAERVKARKCSNLGEMGYERAPVC